ncbi:MAG: hypothetical protein ACI86M_002832 [Saprospiraceae bacterium]|jgi:hypothetical protein
MEQLDYLIDRKILGSITVSEANQLDHLILNQPDIAIDIEKRLEISKAIQYAGNEELRMSLKQIHSEEFPQKSKSELIRLRTILSVAAIFVLGIASYMFLMTNQINEISGNQAYTSYYKPYKASFQSRGESSVINYEKFKNAYSNGNYKEALGTELDEANIKDSEVLLAMGISALEEDELVSAKNYFQVIIDRGDFFFMDHAKWYISMVYLKEENTAKAKGYLQELSTDKQADHNQKSTELLTRIK